jgi:transposase-like protein
MREKLIALVREGWREKPETGYSVRQLAAAVEVSKSTLADWVKSMEPDIEKALRSGKPAVHRNHTAPAAPSPGAELVNDQAEADHVDQGRRVPGVAGVEEYRPDLRMGGIKTSHGVRSEGVPGVEIKTTWYGAPVCSRCAGEALPPGGDRRDLLFDADAAGIHRPVCPDCRREGEQLTGWPGPHGGEMKHAPGYGEKPGPAVHPFADIPLVKTPPSPWSPRPSSGPGVRKYPR